VYYLSSLVLRILYGRLLLFTVVFVQISEHRNGNNSISVFYCSSNYKILLRCVDYSIMVRKGVSQNRIISVQC